MTSPFQPTSETIAHDDLCPICHLLLYAPVRTQCGHVLCGSCMAQWADASTLTRIVPLPLSRYELDFDDTTDVEAGCPMCRTQTAATLDRALAMTLQARYPATYAERRIEEEEASGSRVGEGGVEGIMILVGNKHRLERGLEEGREANKHSWTFFVRVSKPEIVKEVKVYLHPTFRPPSLVLTKQPFEVRRLGWGTFEIKAEIVLKQGYTWVDDGTSSRSQMLPLSWMLSFEDRGMQGRVRTKVNKVEGPVEEEGTARVLRPRRGWQEGAVGNPIVVDEDGDERRSPVRWPLMDPDLEL